MMQPEPTTLYAEQEHTGIRTVAVLGILVAYGLSFFLITNLGKLLSAQFASLVFALACFLALPMALGITWFLEKWLKHVWHSGYSLVLQENGFHVSRPTAAGLDFDLNGRFSHFAWYFILKGYKRGGRERRVPESWRCLCCQVQQNEERVIVYTFASPKQTAVYENNHPLLFKKLNPVNIYGIHLKEHFEPPSRPNKLPPEIVSGKNGRYWLAEQRRWQEGMELTFADFETFISYINVHQNVE